MMETIVPFSGFYESVHDRMLDDAADSMFQDDNGDPVSLKLTEKLHWDCNWGDVHRDYAKLYAENFAAEFKIKLHWETMVSPREYNFTTDRLFAKISLKEVYRLRRETTPQGFQAMARQMFTSRDGFSSWYSPDIATWGGVPKWDHNQVGCLLAAYMEEHHAFDVNREIDLMDGDRGNSGFENLLSEHTPGIQRLYTICDYLRKRKER